VNTLQEETQGTSSGGEREAYVNRCRYNERKNHETFFEGSYRKGVAIVMPDQRQESSLFRDILGEGKQTGTSRP